MIRMGYATDHDGKSKTASAVDQEHYPEQNETDDFERDPNSMPQHNQIAALAYQLWLDRGCPHGSPEDDWHRAEAKLRTRDQGQEPARNPVGRGGSVQS